MRYYHLLQPVQYVEGSKPFTDKERALAFSNENDLFVRSLRAGYPMLVDEASHLRERGVRFTDLRFVFKDQDVTLYRDKCCHVNALGSKLLARKIAEIITDDLEAEGVSF